MTESERDEFLIAYHVAVLSVAADDGRPPHTVPVWYAYEPGGNLTFFTGTQGQRARKTGLIRKAGVVSVCVQQEQLPFKYVTIEGTVVATDRPPRPEQVLAIVRRYLPEEHAQGFVAAELGRPDGTFVLFTVRPDRWLTFDFSDEG